MGKERLEDLSLAEKLKQRHEKVFLIVSPPRCSSTALARVFWHHPAIRYYSHEPYETVYYKNDSTNVAQAHLLEPIDLSVSYKGKRDQSGRGLIIKEMPYQVGIHFKDLLACSTNPIVFLIRDPRLNIMSRIEKKALANQPINFPLIETGWELIQQQMRICEEMGQDYYIVDSTTMRNFPEKTLSSLFQKVGLTFETSMLNWQEATEINLDNLDGKHSHLYQRVLQSSGIEPATESLPTIDQFPETNGFREHIALALRIYNNLKSKSQLV